ncbi:MAG: hypothetical protein U0790_03805 [Isosphaeraceae bacterium]
MFVRRPCYVPAMRAFVCEIDHHGLRRFLPEHLLPSEELAGLARVPFRRSSAILWALLEEPDAEAVLVEMGAGRRRDACELLLALAVELLPIAAALPGASSGDGRSE